MKQQITDTSTMLLSATPSHQKKKKISMAEAPEKPTNIY